MSIVRQTTIPDALRSANRRLSALERSGSVWIYVGTIGNDGVDDLITSDSPPFLNGWTNTLGADAPVSFTIINGWVHIRGAFAGGINGTVIFTLPPGYRPEFQQPLLIPAATLANYATVLVAANGDVTFGTVI